MANLVFAGAGHVFPVAVRRNNCLRGTRWPYRTAAEDAGGLGASNVTINYDNADYFKDWLVFNTLANGGSTPPGIDTTTFGAFTPAPDGTTDTARLIVESTDDTEHSAYAGMQYSPSRFYYGNVRFAGVFKYAGRRIVMSICPKPAIFEDGGNPSVIWGSRAVFDIANGQVAVEHAAFGGPILEWPPHYSPPWTLSPAHIEPVGDGWYLCYIDANPHSFSPAAGYGASSIFCKLSLDNGTGTDAISNTYAGDGTSGVYAWRGNLLPKRAWDMRRTAFFDDFNTSANIDLENTVAEGYDWYIKGTFPSFDWDFVYPGLETITVSDGVISMTDNAPYTIQTFASTWVQPPPAVPRPLDPSTFTHGFVGNSGLGWTLPAIFENRARWSHASNASFWMTSSEWMMYGRNQDPEGLIKGIEVDFWEIMNTSSYYPMLHFHHYPAGPDEILVPGVHQYGEFFNTPAGFIPQWGTNAYPTGAHVHYLGVRYTAVQQAIDQVPLDNPTYWSAYNPSDTISTIAPMVNWVDDFNTYTVMWFPYVSEAEPGQIYMFFNGQYAATASVYGPHISTFGADTETIHLSDSYHVPLFLGLNNGGDVTKKLECEFVRVMQNG